MSSVGYHNRQIEFFTQFACFLPLNGLIILKIRIASLGEFYFVRHQK
jgi:hypothetical protein